MIYKFNYRVDFSTIRDYWDIHRVLKDSLNFPDYYGGNLDALYDCLTDMLCDVSIIEIVGIEKVAEFNNYDQRLIKVFHDTKHAFDNHFFDRFFVTIIHKDGKCEEIE